MGRIANWLPRLWSNWISLLGVVITTVIGCVLLFAIAQQFVSPTANTYALAFILLVLPFGFLFGLLLIPFGLFVYRKRLAAQQTDGNSLTAAMRTIIASKVLRRRALFVGILTAVNIVLIGGAGQQAAHFMDSPKFCGTVCHEVMAPEYEAYLRSPHSRVACVECHIGEGASWAVKAKIDGLRQVWGVMTNDFHRPIPTPVHTLRPARDTCEECHWTEKFHGNRVTHRIHYKDDETNTAEVNLFVLKVGGRNPKTGELEGIHWHVRQDVEVRYEALDEKREKIGKVTVLEKGVVVAEYLPPDSAKDTPSLESRTMDCIDCHNRPTHAYDGAPQYALNFAFESGLLDANVRWLRAVSEPLLAREDRNRDSAEGEYRAELAAAYDAQHPEAKPDAAALDKAAAGLAELYRRNIWPNMKIGWDTYPTHLGHRGDDGDMRGCFRCHDDEHATKEGKSLSQDCDMCHEFLAEEEPLGELSDNLKSLVFQNGE